MMHFIKLLVILSIIYLPFSTIASDYYISAAVGNDNNKGISQEEAWASFNNLEKITFSPGDRILLHAGDSLKGNIYLIELQGSLNKPIIISSYGSGAKPYIDGNGNQAAIYIKNPAHIIIENLEIVNPEGEYGIYLEAEESGELQNVVLKNLNVHDVYATSAEISSPPKTKGGIVLKAQKGEKPSWWNGVLIENCNIHDLGSCGISIGSDYKVNKGIEEGEKTYPILGVEIRHNTIKNIVRDGAIIRQCKGGVMEYNTVSRTGLVAISNGMWWYDSDSCIIQYNEGFACKAAFYRDGAPFSIDNSSTRCIIQFNYSHDNEGAGYMLFGHDDTGWGNIIRHNLSVNDHNSNIAEGIGAIAIVSRVRDAHVHHNIVIAGSETDYVLGHRSWDGFPLEVIYNNNLFIGNGKAKFGEHVLPAGKFEHNLFLNVPNLPKELKQDNNLSDYFSKIAQMQMIKTKASKMD
ncbi:MAG: right-handed parallel beta-helix repeat-containing protein [Bacteroidota bacterium]